MGFENWQHGAGHRHGAVKAGLHQGAQLAVAGVGRCLRDAGASRVDQHVELAKTGMRQRNGGLGLARMGEVERQDRDTIGRFIRQVLQLVRIGGGRHHAVAAVQGIVGKGATKAASCAGDEPDFPGSRLGGGHDKSS